MDMDKQKNFRVNIPLSMYSKYGMVAANTYGFIYAWLTYNRSKKSAKDRKYNIHYNRFWTNISYEEIGDALNVSGKTISRACKPMIADGLMMMTFVDKRNNQKPWFSLNLEEFEIRQIGHEDKKSDPHKDEMSDGVPQNDHVQHEDNLSLCFNTIKELTIKEPINDSPSAGSVGSVRETDRQEKENRGIKSLVKDDLNNTKREEEGNTLNKDIKDKNLNTNIIIPAKKPESYNEFMTYCNSHGIRPRTAKRFWSKVAGRGWRDSNGDDIYDWEQVLQKWVEHDGINLTDDDQSQERKTVTITRHEKVDDSIHKHLNWSYKCECGAVFELDSTIYIDGKQTCPSCNNFIQR